MKKEILASAATFLASAFASAPFLSEYLVYDRTAVIAGELWRLVTCHFVHYSASHLAVNMLVLLPVTASAAREHIRRFFTAMLFSALVMGVFFVAAVPEMRWYAGASGLANAAVAWVSVVGVSKKTRGRLLWGILLTIVFTKSIWETAAGTTLFLGAVTMGEFTPFPLAHLIGAGAGTVAALPLVLTRA